MSYSRTSEPVKFERDCAAVLVPQGESVTLPAGSVGYITQSLGGSFTVFVEGNLFRIAGEDADAIGKPLPEPLRLPEGAGDEEVEKLVWQQLRTCFDPEIPINVVELGLVYACDLEPAGDGGRKASIRMASASCSDGADYTFGGEAARRLAIFAAIPGQPAAKMIASARAISAQGQAPPSTRTAVTPWQK